MRTLLLAIRTENAKLFRSYVLWGTLVFFLFVTGIRVGEGDWATYLKNVVFMFASVFGIVGFGAVAGWTFGREYADRTIKDLLALPVSRGKIVAAKSLSAIIGCLMIVLITFTFALLLGFILGMPGFSMEVMLQQLLQLLIISGLHLLLCGPVVGIACLSRGYLAAMAFAFCTLMVALITGPTPLGTYLPWSIPALQLAQSAGGEVFPLAAASYLIPIVIGLAGYIGTWTWWRWADQK
ncbi:ABC transporter permease [Paenibacillus rubinfantis]|uniref:ABC transporter permease n=1 Tax=Paenibacillus rubinfantis TaxID=1720296 RepID=UPI00073E38BC|nr:ABC transporter permease [Paenibacillus rubinfantis]